MVRAVRIVNGTSNIRILLEAVLLTQSVAAFLHALPLQRISKLLYRSKQRGFLELDLLLGLYAQQQLPQMDDGMLIQFEKLLDEV